MADRFYRITVRRCRIGYRATVEQMHGEVAVLAAEIDAGLEPIDRWHSVANRGWWRPTKLGAETVAERRARQRERSFMSPPPPVSTYEFRPMEASDG